MGVLDATKEKLTAKYSEWIKVEDDKSRWTIEDFPYASGVDEDKTKPHCWKCVTVNKCWFKNEEGKKPVTILNDKNLLGGILKQQGLYHNNCHCREIGVWMPRTEDVKLVITEGKVEYLFTKKFDDVIKQMGYSVDDKIEIMKLYEGLVKEAYSRGNYIIRTHNKFGVSISLFYKFPGKHEKNGKIYNIKSGWTIFPEGKIKANTIMGGFM